MKKVLFSIMVIMVAHKSHGTLNTKINKAIDEHESRCSTLIDAIFKLKMNVNVQQNLATEASIITVGLKSLRDKNKLLISVVKGICGNKVIYNSSKNISQSSVVEEVQEASRMLVNLIKATSEHILKAVQYTTQMQRIIIGVFDEFTLSLRKIQDPLWKDDVINETKKKKNLDKFKYDADEYVQWAKETKRDF